MDKIYIRMLKFMVEIDVRDNVLRDELLERLERDRVMGGFDLGRYMLYYDEFGRFGRRQMDLWREGRVVDYGLRGMLMMSGDK